MIDTEHFKIKLLAEKTILQEELEDLGELNPEIASDWISTPDQATPVDTADDIEIAQSFETFEERNAIQNKLENRLIDVERALQKIAGGTYGLCEVSGEQIELARLEANPAARTNIANKDTTLQ
jgi:RNA polymerase-binding transcription factor DksA